MDSRIVAGGRRIFENQQSKIIKSMALLGKSAAEAPVAVPPGLFHASAWILCGVAKVEYPDLDIEFEVPFDDNTTANEATFTMYNLSTTTRNQFTLGRNISLTAGYGTDRGIIFAGVVSSARTKHDGVDVKTTVTALDNPKLKEHDVRNISFAKGSKASYILRSLLQKTGLPIAAFHVRRDHTYKDVVTVDGGLMSSIDQYAKVCGVSTYIQRGCVYAIDVRTANTGLRFDMDVDHGMIGTPEYFEDEMDETADSQSIKETRKGWKITSLLEHRCMTGALVNLKSKDVTGNFHVLEGKHSFNGTDFITEMTVV